jgi:hypothetical protein
MSMLLLVALARICTCMCRQLMSCRTHFVCHAFHEDFDDMIHIDINTPLCNSFIQYAEMLQTLRNIMIVN